MRIRHVLLTALVTFLAFAGVAAAQSVVPCPECDEDGAGDGSRYQSVDTGVITDDATALVDTDQSVGENQHGRFTWLAICLQFFDALGNHLSLMVDAFVSEDGVDIDAKADVNGNTVDYDELPVVGEVDGMTWDLMDKTGVELPVSPTDVPTLPNVDSCIDLTGTVGITAACE